MILTVVFVQCKKDEKTSSPVPPKETVKNFFTVPDGTFHNEELPASSQGADAPSISEVIGNASVIDGGNTAISVKSNSENIKSVIVSKKGSHGYFLINPSTEQRKLYQVLLVFSSDLPEDEFTIVVAVVDEQDQVSAYYEVLVKKIQNVGAGLLQFSLSFNLLDDIDLHVEQPDGQDIYYANRGGYDYYALYIAASEVLTEEQMSELGELSEPEQVDYLSQFLDLSQYKVKGGWLDLDSNAGCNLDSINNENINYTYISDIDPGEYIVRVDFYADCQEGTEPTNYSVTAKYQGEIIATTSGDNPHQGSFEPNTADFGSAFSGVEVMRVNITPEMLNNHTKGTYKLIYKPEEKPNLSTKQKSTITKPGFKLGEWLKKAN